MSTTNLSDLIETLEGVHQDLHPYLDLGFLKEVIYSIERNPDDSDTSIKEIRNFLNKIIKEGV